MQETWIQSLGWENPLEKGKVTHSSILAWIIPWTIRGSEGKEPTCSAGDPGSIPGSGGSSGVGCHFLLQGDLPDLGIKTTSPVSAAQVAIVKEMTGRNRAAQLEIVKQMSRQ